ncbi:arginine--tRNA ligase [candidate division KSB1 bacterium]|nr:arginine--tRNA ligase [candidate division KSB1 bacterium]
MNIELYLKEKITQSLQRLGIESFGYDDIKIERPKIEAHGDQSTNVAMLLTRLLKKSPQRIAEEILEHLELDSSLVSRVEIAVPGFINFHLGWGYYRQVVRDILLEDKKFGRSDWGGGVRYQIEFVSANPTGPLNVVSARAAAVGDVLVNLLNVVGFDASREFYINDAGRQIRLLGQSVSSRYMSMFGFDESFPEEGYHGDYISEIAGDIARRDGDVYTNMSAEERQETLSRISLDRMVQLHQQIMSEYGVHFDNWFRESELRKSNAQEDVLALFRSKDLVYEQDGALWFRCSQLGDEKDRVLVTSEGEPTYFLVDIAYHKNKFDRGFEKLIDLWGPDHHGYVPRMKAAVVALGHPEESFYVEIIQQVNLLRGGEVVKMSKRAGQIIEMREVIDEVGVDAARFFFINRKISSHLDFDIDVAKSQTEENPVYYLQYAYARICNILKYARENGIDLDEKADLSPLSRDEERNLIHELNAFPDIITQAARGLDPHLLPIYLKNVAALFHHFYHECRVVSDDKALTLARLCLVRATQIVLANGFAIIGISAPESM